MDGLGHMLGGDRVLAVEVGDCACDFQDSVVGAGGEAHAADGHFEGAFAGVVKGGELAELLRGQVGVVIATRLLAGPGSQYTLAHLLGRHAFVVAAQFFVGDGRDFDVEIDAVEQGAGDLAEVALDDRWRATAFFGGIAEKAARLRVYRLATSDSRSRLTHRYVRSRLGRRFR